MVRTRFEWDQGKNRQNQLKHGVAFEFAQWAFADPHRVIAEDLQRGGIMTVRFTYRENGYLAPVTGAEENNL